MSLVDANKLTVARLKSALSENGFSEHLNVREKKAYFVKLYNDLVVPKLLEEQKMAESRRMNDENIPNQENLMDDEGEDRKRKLRRQTLASLPSRTPMTPVATNQMGTPKRIAKRKNPRQSLLVTPSKTALIEQIQESDKPAENVECSDEQVGDVDEVAPSQPPAALPQESVQEEKVQPISLPDPAAFRPSMLPLGLDITPMTSPHHSLVYLRERKRFRQTEEREQEKEKEEKVAQQEEIKEVKEEKEEEKEPEMENTVEREEVQQPVMEKVTFAPQPNISELPSVPKTSETRPLRRRSIMVKPKQAAPQPRSTGSRLFNASMVVLEVVLALGLILFFFPSLLDIATGPEPATPFCDSGMLNSTCLRCPTNGICSGGKVTCSSMHIFRDGACVPDETWMDAALGLKDIAHEMLSERSGHHKCGYEDAPTPYLTDMELRQRLAPASNLQTLGPQSDQRFSLVFDLMHKEVVKNPEWGIIVRTEEADIGVKTTWMVKEASLPFTCALQMRLMDHLWEVLATLAVAVLIPFLMWRRKRIAQENSEVEALVEEVKGLLVAQRKRAEEDEQLRTNAWVPLTHIRDTLLHDDPTRKKRYVQTSGSNAGVNTAGQKKWLKMWDKVVAAVSTDRRILTSPQLFEGEQVTTWEWVSLVPSTARAAGFMSPIKQRRQQSILDAHSILKSQGIIEQQPVAVESTLAPIVIEEEAVNTAPATSQKTIYPSLY